MAANASGLLMLSYNNFWYYKNTGITTEFDLFQDAAEKVGSDESHKNYSRTRENDSRCDCRKGQYF